jgi:uncharacterized protein (DUF1330 family)
MPAYLFVSIEVKDKERYADYVRAVPPSIERYGGRYLARGGRTAQLEGDWEPKRVVILEFPSFERAQAWWASEEYREPKALRQRVAVTHMILVEGV